MFSRFPLPQPAVFNRTSPGSKNGCWRDPLVLVTFALFLLVGCRSDHATPVVEEGRSQDATSDDAFDGTAVTNDLGDEGYFLRNAKPMYLNFQFHSGRSAGHYAIIESLGGGVSAIDYDLDGNIDLMFSGGGDLNEPLVTGRACGLFRNLGSFHFEDVTPRAECSADRFYNHGIFPGDFDGDGFPDLAISGYGGVQLYRNCGDGTFAFWQTWKSHEQHPWSTSLAWGDFDGDGHLDCYVAHYVDWSWQKNPPCSAGPQVPREVCPPRAFQGVTDAIYVNDGRGGFERRVSEIGLVAGGKGLGVVAGDINQNGHVDLYVANDTTDNFLYWNDGYGRFQEQAILAGVSGDSAGVNTGSMGIALADLNGNGLPDLWVTNFERELFALYRNEGNRLFSHISRSAGIGAIEGLYVGFGTVAIDLLATGRQNLFVANGHVSYHSAQAEFLQQPLWLSQTASGSFVRRQPGGYFGQRHSGRGLIHVDLDNNGSWDLVFTHLEEQPAVLATHHPKTENWSLVRLVGTGANRDAIGATLTVPTVHGADQYLVCGGGSYLSQSDLRLRLVHDHADPASSVKVRWPGGTEELFSLPASRAQVTWVEGSGLRELGNESQSH